MEMAKHKCSEDQRNVWAWGSHGGTDGNVVLNHVTRPSLKFNWQSACNGICFLCEYTEACIWSWWGRNLETCTSHLASLTWVSVAEAPWRYLKRLISTELLLVEPDLLLKLVWDPARQLMSFGSWEALSQRPFLPSFSSLSPMCCRPSSITSFLIRAPRFCSMSHSHHHRHPRGADLWVELGATNHSLLSVLLSWI